MYRERESGRKEIKLPIFISDMIIYTENPKKASKT
jgi:hypothetical protein